ncbi:hypothetical protein Tco_0151234 [Tanacetum coccineum]
MSRTGVVEGLTPSDIQHSTATQIWGCYRLVSRAKVIENQPGRAFWGADDEEISEGGIPRVIILGYDGLPMQPVAPPLPDYIPCPEDLQTPLVPQDEDEHEPMFCGAALLRLIHLLLSHPDMLLSRISKRIQRSTRMMRQRMFRLTILQTGEMMEMMMTVNSSRDDANDEDEDEDEDEEEEHLAPTNSAVVVPTDEPVSPPKGTELVIPPPLLTLLLGLGLPSGLRLPYPFHQRQRLRDFGLATHHLTIDSRSEHHYI